MDFILSEKLKNHFADMVVYKDLKHTNFFSTLSLPSFMRDWLLHKFQDGDTGELDKERLIDSVHRNLPKREEWTSIKNRLIIEREHVKFLARISADIDIKTSNISFALPDYGLSPSDSIIDESVWAECAQYLTSGRDTWGIVTLGYRDAENYDARFSSSGKMKSAKGGKIKLLNFKHFCPYHIDIDFYKDARKEFTTEEWIDVLLAAIDYNPDGYGDENQKITMLTRILPFLEKRLNLIELAPKGTGKSYLYGRVSRFGWLSSGGTMTRAKMFYDQNKGKDGIIANNDFVVLDEIQTISFGDTDEMRAALKGYLESGEYTIGNHKNKSDAGFILCGNISKEIMDQNGYVDMFQELPKELYESALVERFHGFIKGWDIPRMNDDLKIDGWALNSEYFCSILHELRNDMSYRTIVDELTEVPAGADTRDTEAIKRIATAYLKLIFPYVRTPGDLDPIEFNRYCLQRAKNMRDLIRVQLANMDAEYKGKDIPNVTVKPIYKTPF